MLSNMYCKGPQKMLNTVPGENSSLYLSNNPLGGDNTFVSAKREAGISILNKKGKAVLPLFSVCNKYMGVY